MKLLKSVADLYSVHKNNELIMRLNFMRSKFNFFMRSNFSIIFDNFDQEVDTSIMRSKFANNAF